MWSPFITDVSEDTIDTFDIANLSCNTASWKVFFPEFYQQAENELSNVQPCVCGLQLNVTRALDIK